MIDGSNFWLTIQQEIRRIMGFFVFFVDCLSVRMYRNHYFLFFPSCPLVNEAYSTKCSFNHFRMIKGNILSEWMNRLMNILICFSLVRF